MMIPGQWEGRPRTAVTVAQPTADTIPPLPIAAPTETPPARRRELPGWARVSVFGVMLLAATWVAMWLEAVAR